MAWLFGIKALCKIWRLKRCYQSSVVQAYNDKMSTDFSSFHPLMGLVVNDAIDSRHFEKISHLIGSSRRRHYGILSREEHGLFRVIDTASLNSSLLVSSDFHEQATKLAIVKKALFKVDPILYLLDKVLDIRTVFLHNKNFQAMSMPQMPMVIFTTVDDGSSNFLLPNAVAAYVHELYHQVIFLYEAADDLIHRHERNRPILSPIKGRRRPAIRTFHASVALTVMVHIHKAFLRQSLLSSIDHEQCHNRCLELEAMAGSTLMELSKNQEIFTDFGRILYKEVENEFKKIKSESDVDYSLKLPCSDHIA